MSEFDLLVFGEDLTPNGSVPLDGIAVAAWTAYLLGLANAGLLRGIEDFERFKDGDTPNPNLNLKFGTAVDGTLTSSSTDANHVGTFPSSFKSKRGTNPMTEG